MNKPANYLVFQTGRVGSNSVVRALENQGIPALHVHYLYEPAAPNHGNLKSDTRYIGTNLTYPVRFITIIRDPISVAVSDWFRTRIRTSIRQLSPDEIAQDIMANRMPEWTVEWWTTQFEPFTGKSAANAMSNLKDQHYSIFNFTKGVGIILRTENLSTVGSQILSQITGKEIKIEFQNSTVSRTDIADVYWSLMPKIKFPNDYLKSLYRTPPYPAAYTQKEIDLFLTRWSRFPS